MDYLERLQTLSRVYFGGWLAAPCRLVFHTEVLQIFFPLCWAKTEILSYRNHLQNLDRRNEDVLTSGNAEICFPLTFQVLIVLKASEMLLSEHDCVARS